MVQHRQPELQEVLRDVTNTGDKTITCRCYLRDEVNLYQLHLGLGGSFPFATALVFTGSQWTELYGLPREAMPSNMEEVLALLQNNLSKLLGYT